VTSSDRDAVADTPVIVTVTRPLECSRCHCRSTRVAFLKKAAIVSVVCESCLR
jgi:hypothetical protein